MVQGRHHLTLRSSVHAYIAGEHDDSEIPLWTSASIGAVRCWTGRPVPGRRWMRAVAMTFLVRWCMPPRSHPGKGATNYAIGPAGARVVSLAFGLTLGFLLGLIVVPLRSVRLRWASRPVHWWLG